MTRSVQPLDALTLVAAAGILVLTAIVASPAPAARAMRVGPAVTQRGDA